jgi:proline racemase
VIWFPSQISFSSVLDFRIKHILICCSGILELTATIKDSRCESIGFRTPLAYFVGSVDVTLDHGVQVSVDVAYGGQYYAFLPASAVSLPIQPDHIDALIVAAGGVRRVLAWNFKAVDQRTGLVPEVGNIVWTAPPESPGADARNVPVSAAGSFDRSPCGTATCARMAALVAQNSLAVGEDFVNESILGTRYYGKVIAAHAEIANGIVPQVEGSAWVTGRSHLLLDHRDPLGLGYLIGGGKAVI